MVSGQGRGSNLGAIMAGCSRGEIPGSIVLVIGTRTDSPALERAREAGIPVSVVSPRKYEGDDSAYAAALNRVLGKVSPELVCLAGYMRKLPDDVLNVYSGRVMNIHNALLPLFGGKGMFGENVHRAVLESGMKVSGCTVHFVDGQYDAGPIIVQAAVPVLDNDTPATLAERVLVQEHLSYVRAVRLFALGQLSLEGCRVLGAYPAPE
jgi:formyltetrahydrofolate-dependent phosphoribosylglycinamide formyltransferase